MTLEENPGGEAQSKEITGGELAGEREKLLADLTAAAEEIKNLNDQIARARADFYNYRTRVERDRERDRKLAAEQAVTELLPVLENLERICASVEQDGQLHKGISMVAGQFASVLCGLGLEQICTEGEFDPNVHEAVHMQPVDDESKDGFILNTLRKGYKLAGRVIKAAQVSVGKFTDTK